jgi:hypothetical protein
MTMRRLSRSVAALVALLAVVPVAGAGCRKEPPPPAFSVEENPAPPSAGAPATGPAAEAPPGGSFVGRWRGTLPCADCPGIDTELELYAGAGGISGPFHLVETYAGRPADRNRVETKGEWLAQRGSERDPEATVYRFEPAGGGAARFFLAVEDDLEALDGQARPLTSRGNLRLRLIEDPHGAAPGP